MSADGEEQQVLRLTIEEALVLRGAFNVVCEILGRRGLRIPPGIPVSRDRKALFDRLEGLLNNRLDQPVVGAFTDPAEASFQEVLDPAEAQAVRDVAGALETMLQDPDGQELLVGVGFLVEEGQPVDREEIATLRDIINRVEPTGVREAPEGFPQANGGIPLVADNAAGPEDRALRFFPDRHPRERTPEEQLSRIDFLRSSVEEHLDDPVLIDIDEDEIEGIIRALLPRAREGDDCDELLVSLAELVDFGARAVAGKRRQPGSQGQDAAIRAVEDARRLVIAQMDDLECIPRDDLRDLRNSVLSVTEPLRSDPDDVETRAFAALSDIHNTFRDPRRGGMGMAA